MWVKWGHRKTERKEDKKKSRHNRVTTTNNHDKINTSRIIVYTEDSIAVSSLRWGEQ